MLTFNTQAAAELLHETRCDDISVEAIAKVIERHLEGIIEDALDDPEYFFRDRYRFWNDLDKAALDEEKQSSIAA